MTPEQKDCAALHLKSDLHWPGAQAINKFTNCKYNVIIYNLGDAGHRPMAIMRAVSHVDLNFSNKCIAFGFKDKIFQFILYNFFSNR